MRITYACPACQATTTLDGIETRETLDCAACGAVLPISADAIAGRGTDQPARLTRCLVCPSLELFVRKDFPQRLGVAIVVLGLAASCVAWANRELVATFAILFGPARRHAFFPDARLLELLPLRCPLQRRRRHR